jgi:hypothetical protein
LGGSPRRLFFCKRTQRPGRRKSGSVLGWTATGHRLTAVGLGPTDRSPFEGLRSSTTAVQPRFGSVAPTLEGVDPTSRPLVGRGSQAFDGRGPGAVGARPISSPRFGASDAEFAPARSHASPVQCQRLAPYLPAGISRQVVGRLMPVGFAGCDHHPDAICAHICQCHRRTMGLAHVRPTIGRFVLPRPEKARRARRRSV